ncbi:putative ribonuclease H-like domain-containing protein [Tanacetum coccineum]
MKKMYCLVVTDDFSRFTWVFFLATKDETSGILKSFITGIENLVDHKGILRQFSVARTPQQNGVAERRNRILIEAARTMIADSKLPTTFWAEVVNTACYVQNKVLVVTSSRPDIMFAVCACARYQVNPKVSHLHVVKRILEGQPKLGLWYPKDSPFDLVAYTDSDYVGASLDRQSTTGDCQFL